MEAELTELSQQRATTTATAEQSENAALAAEANLTTTAEAIRASELQGAQIREAIATREATLEHHRRRSDELAREAERLRRQLAAVNVRAGSLQQQLRETADHVTEAAAEHAQVAAIAATEDARLAEVGTRLSAIRRQAEQSREAFLAESRRASQWDSEASSLAARLEGIQAREQQLLQRLTDLDGAHAAATSELAELTQHESRAAESAEDCQRRAVEAKDKLNSFQLRQREARHELDQTRQKHAAARERAAVLQEFERRREGYSEAVKEVLTLAHTNTSGLYQHVRGVVAELLQVSLAMAPLVEIALGERAQHVVVTSIDEVLAALRLDPQRFPNQVTFTPVELRDQRPAAREIDLHGRPGIVGRADEFVETSSPYVPLAVRLLGRTWIVDTLDRAASLASEQPGLNFITTAGEARWADGTISFGECAPSAGLISRRSELETLDKQVQELDANISRNMALLAELARSLDETRQSLQSAESDLAHATSRQAELRSQVGSAKSRAAQIAEEQQRVRAEQASAARSTTEIQSKMHVAAERSRESRAALGDLEQQALVLASQTAALDNERSTIEAAVATTKIELGKREERLANLRLRARQLEQDQRERQRTVAEAAAELTHSVDKGRESDRVILAGESELAQLYLDKEQSARDTAHLVAQQDAQRANRAAFVAETQRLRIVARELDERIHAHELATHEVRHSRTTVADRLRDDYGLDLAQLEHEVTSDESRQRDEIDAEIAELRRKITHIGNVNLDALAELEELEGRFAHLSDQHRDLSSAKQSLVEIIDRINTDSRRLFAETLEKVRANFQTLFRKLFGGGQADIVLDDESDMLESGIEIVARPPGKEPRNISLLSGGEKTLTCVALLLAIFQYRPSPFCVLDEVDAALDEANIERFIGVLQEFLAWTQFIVITHSKKTMTCATTLYGVTMQESGVSKRVAVRFEDITSDGALSTASHPADASPAGDETQAA